MIASATIELNVDELREILAKTAKGPLTDEQREKLETLLQAYVSLTETIQDEKITLRQLRELLLGTSTEKTKKVLSEGPEAEEGSPARERQKKKKRKGHGRKGAEDYPGAEKIPVPHESLKAGEPCPDCSQGRVYAQKKPAVIVRLRGEPPIQATIFERERLRCNLCGEVFTAKLPADVDEEKYEASSKAMMALLKYGSGLPFNRLERLQGTMGIPLPASTQWEIVRDAALDLEPILEELIRVAAQGEVLHNDDTSVKILELMGRAPDEEDDLSPDRTGLFTSGIVSTSEGQRIALFLSGRQHAGENLRDVLARRAQELEAPIQMCDALSRNLPKDLEVILGNCLAHGRRYFVKVVENFPDECRHVLEALRDVYRIDALAKEQRLSDTQRLELHQARSAPIMEELEKWFEEQLDQKKVEPNSGLGRAIQYMRNHWEKLTLFLRQPGAPIDNNICERALKKAILHRRNSLFYKTLNGAHVGDLFMTLIHTAELAGANPFDYLEKLLEHKASLSQTSSRWMPWNYLQAAEIPAAD